MANLFKMFHKKNKQCLIMDGAINVTKSGWTKNDLLWFVLVV